MFSGGALTHVPVHRFAARPVSQAGRYRGRAWWSDDRGPQRPESTARQVRAAAAQCDLLMSCKIRSARPAVNSLIRKDRTRGNRSLFQRFSYVSTVVPLRVSRSTSSRSSANHRVATSGTRVSGAHAAADHRPVPATRGPQPLRWPHRPQPPSPCATPTPARSTGSRSTTARASRWHCASPSHGSASRGSSSTTCSATPTRTHATPSPNPTDSPRAATLIDGESTVTLEPLSGPDLTSDRPALAARKCRVRRARPTGRLCGAMMAAEGG